MKGWDQAAIDRLRSGMAPGVAKKRSPKPVAATPKYGINPVRLTMAAKPMSVNVAWQGQRFKTDAYKVYEQHLLLALPDAIVPAPPYRICYEFGFSNPGSDWDNPVKPLQDILQKRYGFNDRDIMKAEVTKVIVRKGEEYFAVSIETLP